MHQSSKLLILVQENRHNEMNKTKVITGKQKTVNGTTNAN